MLRIVMMLIVEPWERACLSPPLVSKERPYTKVLIQGIGALPCSSLGDSWKKTAADSWHCSQSLLGSVGCLRGAHILPGPSSASQFRGGFLMQQAEKRALPQNSLQVELPANCPSNPLADKKRRLPQRAPAFDEVFQVSVKSQRWKCSLQGEMRSLHVFVRKTFKVFHKRKEEIFVLICIRTGGILVSVYLQWFLWREGNSLMEVANICVKEKKI